MRHRRVLLVLIFLVGLILRFYQLGAIPVGFHRDEAFFGYNAYSILKTGAEITGNFLPIHLKSFLFSPAVYSYISIPFIAIFGLDEFSVRAASALFGSLIIITTYFLVLELFFKKNFKYMLAIVSSLFIAISPWSINLSRVATENVVVVFLVSLGTIFYSMWFRKNKLKYGLTSFFLFFVALFTYQASRSFLPLFLPLVFLYFNDFKIKFSPKIKLSLILYVLLIVLPLILILKSPDLSLRIRSLSIFNNPKTQLILDEQLRQAGVMKVSPGVARIFHNKVINYTSTFVNNYVEHFSFDFLFSDKGLPDRYRIPNGSLLYVFDLPLLILGIYFLLKFDKNNLKFLVLWIALVPVGSALTFDDIPNLQRTLIFFPAVSIVSATGLIFIIEKIKGLKKMQLYFVYLILLSVLIYSFGTYLYSYFIDSVVYRPWYRQEGYKELASFVESNVKNYKYAIITNRETDPAIFFMFYGKYDPKYIQNTIKKSGRTDYGSISFAKYKFSDEECPVKLVIETNPTTLVNKPYIKGEKNVLYVDEGTCKIPAGMINLLKEIKRKDGTTVFKIFVLK